MEYIEGNDILKIVENVDIVSNLLEMMESQIASMIENLIIEYLKMRKI